MCHRRLILFLVALVLCIPAQVMAGNFKVVPIKIFMDAKSKTSLIKIRNDDREQVTVQLEARAWSQDEEGKDVYEDTKDIILFPKMADIKPGEERIIRIGFRGTASASEKSYRLYVQELPVSKPGEMALKFALRMGIPIFIKPMQERKQKSIEKVEISKGMLHIRVKNSGNSHVVISKISATGVNATGKEVFNKVMGGWYVLPGVTKTFDMKLAQAECAKSKSINLAVEEGKNRMDTDMKVDADQCGS